MLKWLLALAFHDLYRNINIREKGVETIRKYGRTAKHISKLAGNCISIVILMPFSKPVLPNLQSKDIADSFSGGIK